MSAREATTAGPKITLVAALDLAGVIGVDNKLPWHLPRDLAHFKSVTLGKPVIMGRRTFESIGRPLPQRTNIVLSRDPASRFASPAGCELARSLDEALALAAARGAADAMVIGGAAIFAAALPRAARLCLTVVEARVRGDTYFPPVPAAAWHLVGFERAPADERNAYACDFVTLERGPGDELPRETAPIDWAALVAERAARAAPRAV